MNIIAFANQKGGVGRTTTTASVAFDLPGRKLIIDMDPQASMTEMLGVQPAVSIYNVLGDSKPGTHKLESITINVAPGVDLAPSDVELALSETGLIIGQKRWEYLLSKAVATVAHRYDWILIDCPPNLGALTTCAIIAADYVIVPTLLSYMSIKGMNLFLETLRSTQADYGKDAGQLMGVVCTIADLRLVVARELHQSLQERNDITLFDTIIPKAVAFEEAALMNKAIQQYAPDSKAAQAIKELAEEIANHG